MALGGLAPLLVFQFSPILPIGNDLSGAGVINLLSQVTEVVGVPVPIYLDEKLTGIYVESETRAVDIDTNAQQLRDGSVQYDQRGLSSLVSISLLASQNSILLTALLALSDLIFQKVVAKAYKVSYFNGPTVIINGLLHGFQTSTSDNDDLIRITLQISKANQESTVTSTVSVLPKITGAVPIAVGG